MNYRIHDNTIFIEGNGIIGHYMVQGNQVVKFIQLASGDEVVEPFHTIGELPLNTEAKLLNELREDGQI
jgi:hypothetical protein